MQYTFEMVGNCLSVFEENILCSRFWPTALELSLRISLFTNFLLKIYGKILKWKDYRQNLCNFFRLHSTRKLLFSLWKNGGFPEEIEAAFELDDTKKQHNCSCEYLKKNSNDWFSHYPLISLKRRHFFAKNVRKKFNGIFAFRISR